MPTNKKKRGKKKAKNAAVENRTKGKNKVENTSPFDAATTKAFEQAIREITFREMTRTNDAVVPDSIGEIKLNKAETKIFQEVMLKHKAKSGSTEVSKQTLNRILVDTFGAERTSELFRKADENASVYEMPSRTKKEIKVNSPSTSTNTVKVTLETHVNNTLEVFRYVMSCMKDENSKLEAFFGMISRMKADNIGLEAETTIIEDMTWQMKAANIPIMTVFDIVVDVFGPERAKAMYDSIMKQNKASPETKSKLAEPKRERKKQVKNVSAETLKKPVAKTLPEGFSKHEHDVMSQMAQLPPATLYKLMVEALGPEKADKVFREMIEDKESPFHRLGPEEADEVFREMTKNKESQFGTKPHIENCTEEKTKEPKNASVGRLPRPSNIVKESYTQTVREMLMETFRVERERENGAIHTTTSSQSQPQQSPSSSLSRREQQEVLPVRFTCRRYVNNKSSMMWTICFDSYKTTMIHQPMNELSLRNEVQAWLYGKRETIGNHEIRMFPRAHESVAAAVTFVNDEIDTIKSQGYVYKESHRVGFALRQNRNSTDDKELKADVTIATARANTAEAEAASTEDGMIAVSKAMSASSIELHLRALRATLPFVQQIDPSGDYCKFAEEWVFVDDQGQIPKTKEFYSTHARLMGDEQLAPYLFSFATRTYFYGNVIHKGDSSVEKKIRMTVKSLIRLGHIIKQVQRMNIDSESCVQLLKGDYHYDIIMLKTNDEYYDDSTLEVPKKLRKFLVQDIDLDTNRGLITQLAKVDPTGSAKEFKALNSEVLPKIGTCNSCSKTFQRKDLYVCACHRVQYCSKTCQISDWSVHKKQCKPFRRYVRSVQSMESKMAKSQSNLDAARNPAKASRNSIATSVPWNHISVTPLGSKEKTSVASAQPSGNSTAASGRSGPVVFRAGSTAPSGGFDGKQICNAGCCSGTGGPQNIRSTRRIVKARRPKHSVALESDLDDDSI